LTNIFSYSARRSLMLRLWKQS